MERNNKHLIGVLAIFAITIFTVAFASGQITTQETGPSAINITTDAVTDIKETEANFQATLAGFDNTDYDAALIYWNYSTDSALDQAGPATIENTEKQRSVFHPDLAPDTSYNVEAYAEPIVWDDSTLMENYGDTLARSSFVGEYPSEFKPDLSQTYSQYSNTSETGVSVTSDMAMSPNGKKLITLDSYQYSPSGYYNDVRVYNLSTPYDLKTAEQNSTTSVGSGDAYEGLHVSPDGTRMAVSVPGNEVKVYELSDSWDMGTASQTSSMTLDEFNPTGHGIFFSPGGNQMFLSEDNQEVRSYNLAEAWNLSTASEIDIINPSSDAAGLALTDDGSKMLLSNSNGGIQAYDLSTSWDISTYSSASSLSTSNEAYGLAVSPNGDRIIYSGYDYVYGLKR